MPRPIQTTGPLKQLNHKTLQERFTKILPVDLWEPVHTFEEHNLKLKEHNLYIYIYINIYFFTFATEIDKFYLDKLFFN